MLKNTFSKSVIVFLLLVITLAGIVSAADEYKPYLHNAKIPEHPKLKLYGSYSTNLFPGAATYSYGIEVPSGRNGLTPALAISYNSQNTKSRSGILGSGWQVTNNYIFRDANSTLNNTGDDFFVLVLNDASNELVYVNSEYRVKHDNHLRVQNISNNWLITSKDGLQFNFSAKITSPYGQTSRWYLDEITDAYGNKIFYSYLTNPNSDDSNAVYLDKIEYNNERARKVQMFYESNARPDRRRAYEHGLLIEESRRLAAINISADNNTIRRYEFKYSLLTLASSSLSSILYLGADGSKLNNISMEYHNTISGYAKYTSSYYVPVYFSESGNTDSGVRLEDLNNDGYIDFIKGKKTASEKKAWLNQKNGSWLEHSSFAPPVYITDSIDRDNGVRFADLNNDGFIDLIQAENTIGDGIAVYLNNGSGWAGSAQWKSPVFFIASYDRGVQLADLNGDGRIDILQSSFVTGETEQKSAFLNNGSGWTNASLQFISPVYFSYDGKDQGVRVMDINGDNLPDIIKASDLGQVIKSAFLNNGSGWVNATSTWNSPIVFTSTARVDEGARFADVNADGLVDILEDYENGSSNIEAAYINNGSGWVRDDSWQSPEPFTLNGLNIGRRIGDVNGDGFGDVIVGYVNSSSYNYTWLRNATFPGLLKKVTNEYGGVTEISYAASTSFNNTGNDSLSDLGFNLWVVNNVTQNNSVSGSFNAFGKTNYSYLGGRYDYADLEFRGFARVDERKNDNSIMVHYFFQDDALKGRKFKTESFDSGNTLLTRQENSFNYTVNGSFRIFLTSTANYLFDGNANARITNTSYSYDSFGNVIIKTSLGETNNTGDEKYEYFEYAYNTSSYIVDKIKRYRLFGSDNTTLVRESKNSYDNGLYGSSPTKGSVTQTEAYNDQGNNPITRYTYDSFGNLKTETNALGQVTSYLYGIYDPTHTYISQITNALNHRTLYNYDLGTGNLLWTEKNGIRTEYKYDTFGRKTKDILPLDSESQPTKEYTYTFDGTPPEIILVKDRTHGNETSDTYFYYDGFANLIQLKRESDNGRQIIKNIFYDGMFRVKEEQNPYFANFNSSLSTPSNTTNRTFYTYDTLGRIIKVINPDGTNNTINFNKTLITTYDANKHKKDYLLDSYDRIAKVIEYNNEPVLRSNVEIPYTTSYNYDAQDNLVKITDTLNNEFKFSYDSLGRKISMDDPDLGRWTYQYDVLGNLITQKDNRLKTINLTYDRLNRVIAKITTPETINFTYDLQLQGTLTNVSGLNFSKRFTYDDRARPIREEELILDTWFTTANTYDSMNRIVETLTPNKEELEFYYNEQGKINKIRGYMNATAYNAFDNPLNRSYFNNKITTFAYDSQNARLSQIKTDTIQQLNYTYDNTGNVLSILDPINVRNHFMEYDFLDRLVNVSINGSKFVYSYNAIGNILKVLRDNNATYYKYGTTPIHAPSQLVTGSAGIDIYEPKDLNTGSTKRIREFYLANELNNTFTNANFTITLADGNTVYASQGINISDNVLVFVEHGYNNGGDFTINVSSINSSDFEPLATKFGTRSNNISKLVNNQTLTIFEWYVQNDINSTAASNWDCSVVASTIPFNLTNETAMVFIEYNFSAGNQQDFNCQINSSHGNDSDYTNITITGIKIENYNSSTPSDNIRTVSFDIKNYYYPLTASWTITSDGNVQSGSTSLAQNGVTSIVRNISYTTGGIKTIIINVSSGSFTDSKTEQVYVNSLNIVDYFLHNLTGINKLVEFYITNFYPSNVTASWNLTEPNISSSTSVNLSEDESVLVFIETNYSSQGTKQPTLTVSNGTLTSTFTDFFPIKMIQSSYQTLSEVIGSTISEIIARNNIENRTLSWRLDTPQQTIVSTQMINISQNEEVMIFIESNYTESNIGNISAYVNFTNFNDTVLGYVIT